jgi:PAS domain S-box-containing protein
MTLALAVVAASDAPVLLLDESLTIVAASRSFSRTFGLDPANVAGMAIYDIDHHHWDVPRLRSLIGATLAGLAEVDTYELDIRSSASGVRRVVLKAQQLEYGVAGPKRLLVTAIDVTDIRRNEALQRSLVHDNALLLHEIQHRVANSLQIIASILMQSARKVQSDEARGHLSDAHQRVMSIATLQRQLAESSDGTVRLAPYLAQLCESIGASMIFDHGLMSIATRIDDVTVSREESVSIGLVITELVINALKHAFPKNRQGKIDVDYAVQLHGWTLSVADDGIGMPENADDATAGLGTSIVQALAKQLDTRITVTDQSPGTLVTLTHVALQPGELPVEHPAV